jgi:hypothetical protein
MNIILVNKAFSHSLTLKNIAESILATNFILATNSILAINFFIYILNISSSQYISDMFLDIVVNTETSKKSIAGYS